MISLPQYRAFPEIQNTVNKFISFNHELSPINSNKEAPRYNNVDLISAINGIFEKTGEELHKSYYYIIRNLREINIEENPLDNPSILHQMCLHASQLQDIKLATYATIMIHIQSSFDRSWSKEFFKNIQASDIIQYCDPDKLTIDLITLLFHILSMNLDFCISNKIVEKIIITWKYMEMKKEKAYEDYLLLIWKIIFLLPGYSEDPIINNYIELIFEKAIELVPNINDQRIFLFIINIVHMAMMKRGKVSELFIDELMGYLAENYFQYDKKAQTIITKCFLLTSIFSGDATKKMILTTPLVSWMYNYAINLFFDDKVTKKDPVFIQFITKCLEDNEELAMILLTYTENGNPTILEKFFQLLYDASYKIKCYLAILFCGLLKFIKLEAVFKFGLEHSYINRLVDICSPESFHLDYFILHSIHEAIIYVVSNMTLEAQDHFRISITEIDSLIEMNEYLDLIIDKENLRGEEPYDIPLTDIVIDILDFVDNDDHGEIAKKGRKIKEENNNVQ